MAWFVRMSVATLLALAAVRAVLFLATAWLDLGNPGEVLFLEAKFVHLCWRAQEGLAMYPDWREYPYVPNFFGPLYPMVVGGLGKLLSADVDRLTVVARGVTLGASVLGAVVAGASAGKRHGTVGGLVAGSLMMGALPTMRFGWMARPDLMADTLGLAGLVVSTWPRKGWRWVLAGALLMAAAGLTKQTALVYALAAGLGLLMEGRWRSGVGVVLGSSALAAGTVAVASWAWSPSFGASMLAERVMPMDPLAWRFLLLRTRYDGPDLWLLPLLGLAAWRASGERDAPALSLAAVGVPLMGLASLKMGADYNYYLPIRAAGALGAGAWAAWVWERARREPRVGGWVAAVTIVAAVFLLPGVDHARVLRMQTAEIRRRYESEGGQQYLAARAAVYEMAGNPTTPMLTDLGLVALHQGNRAAFVDPWLFRALVGLGEIKPTAMLGQIRRGQYLVIVSSRPLDDPDYELDQFAFPPPVARAILRNYVKAGDGPGTVTLYVPAASLAPTTSDGGASAR